MNFAIAIEEMGIQPTKLGEVCLGLRDLSPKIYPDVPESAGFDLEFDPCLHRGLRYDQHFVNICPVALCCLILSIFNAYFCDVQKKKWFNNLSFQRETSHNK